MLAMRNTSKNHTRAVFLFDSCVWMNEAFSISDHHLIKFIGTKQDRSETNLVITKNLLYVSKFCEIAQLFNVDPMHKWALHVVIILMCKFNPISVARKFSEDIQCTACIGNIEEDKEMYARCSSLFSTMSDWIALFEFLELNVGNRTSSESESTPESTRNPTNKRILHELENNQCLNRMVHALAAAQVAGENMTPMETAIYSFLYISPRTTPAGRMLERLYCGINSRAQDPELRCLRVLSQFNDTTDIETGFSDTMSLVMRCFSVKDNFQRLVENVLRQKKDVVQVVTTKTIRPLLRNLATEAVQKKILQKSMENWSTWKNAVNFPITTSLYIQKLLYFICVQPIQPAVCEYQHLFHIDILNRISRIQVDVIDVGCVCDVLRNLRKYNGEIACLIDFRHKCLFGINEKTRQEISLTQVMQLYISIYQHPSIVESCWRQIVPIFNHTIRTNIEEFKNKNPYQVSEVLKNLVQSILD